MLTRQELRQISRSRLRDAEVLFNGQRYDGAIYMCGYAVELALKARICVTLKWTEFPATAGEFKDLQSLRTHNFEVLLRLSGRQDVRRTHIADWSVVGQWGPDIRYRPPGITVRDDAKVMIEATRRLLKVL